MSQKSPDRKIFNDAGKYGLKTPPYSNKWGFTDRANLDCPPIDITAVRASMKYIEQNFDLIKTFNISHSSYKIKHIVQKKIEQYVANGELIIAMINCGFKFQRWPGTSANCFFNASRKSLNKARKEKHPTSY